MAANGLAQRPSSTPSHGLRTPQPPSSSSSSSSSFTSTPHTVVPHPPAPCHPDEPQREQSVRDTQGVATVLESLGGGVSPPSPAAYRARATSTENKTKDRKESRDVIHDDLSTTSGIESDGGDDDDEGSDEDEEADDNGDSSDSESGGFEPSLDDIRRHLPNPQSIFPLRPENLDALYIPEDARRVELDVAEPPPYEFSCPLPPVLDTVSLPQCAGDRGGWREVVPSWSAVETPLQGLMDRLLEKERLQTKTEEWEARKLRGRRRRQEKVVSNSSGNRASSSRARDRRVVPDQAACAEDCPDKQQSIPGHCDTCLQPLCTGTCQNNILELHARHVPSSDNLETGESPTAQPTPSPSRLGVRRHSAKLISPSGLVVVRPKSCVATASRTKTSSRPRDVLRPTSAVSVTTALVKDFQRLGVDPQPPVPPGKILNCRPRSRNSLLPARAFKSNRRNSIGNPGSKRDRNKCGRSLKVLQPAS